MASFFNDQILPIIIVSGVVLSNNLLNKMSLEDKFTWFDVAINVISFTTSRFLILSMTDSIPSETFYKYSMDILIEPITNGLINGALYELMYNEYSKSHIRNNLQGRNMYIRNPYTFKDGFYKGVEYNIITNYLSNPLK